MAGDEVLRVHNEVFYGALESRNYAALEALYSVITCLCDLMAPS
jgi:hypothetical protein